MQSFAEHFGFHFVAHAIDGANRSARVERPFHYIERNFYPGRSFESLTDADTQLRTAAHLVRGDEALAQALAWRRATHAAPPMTGEGLRHAWDGRVDSRAETPGRRGGLAPPGWPQGRIRRKRSAWNGCILRVSSLRRWASARDSDFEQVRADHDHEPLTGLLTPSGR